jgi:hypothetical protein
MIEIIKRLLDAKYTLCKPFLAIKRGLGEGDGSIWAKRGYKRENRVGRRDTRPVCRSIRACSSWVLYRGMEEYKCWVELNITNLQYMIYD